MLRRTVFPLLLLAVACGSSSPTAPAPRFQVAVQITGGDAQAGTVGTELPVALVAQVTDAKTLAPSAGVLVNWVVTSGGGAVFASATMTDALGQVRQRWTLGTVVADSQVLEARAVDPTTGAAVVYARATATALPGAAASFDVVPTAVRVVWGDTARVAYRYLDQYGNRTPDCVGGGLRAPTWTSPAPEWAWYAGMVSDQSGEYGLIATTATQSGGTSFWLHATTSCTAGGSADSLTLTLNAY